MWTSLKFPSVMNFVLDRFKSTVHTCLSNQHTFQKTSHASRPHVGEDVTQTQNQIKITGLTMSVLMYVHLIKNGAFRELMPLSYNESSINQKPGISLVKLTWDELTTNQQGTWFYQALFYPGKIGARAHLKRKGETSKGSDRTHQEDQLVEAIMIFVCLNFQHQNIRSPLS